MVHSSKNASALERSPSKMAGSLPLSFVPLLQSSGSLLVPAACGGLPPPPPPPPPSGARYGNPEPLNQPGLGVSSGGAPPFRTEEVPSSVVSTFVGSVVVCVAITVVMGGSLEEAVQLLGLDRVGMCSASFSNCLSLFSSSRVGILMLILSGCPSLLLSL